MLQLVLTLVIYMIIVIPVGRYMYHIAAGKHTLADPVYDRVDGLIYKIGGVNPHHEMDWKEYALALIGTNAVMILIGYIILRVQSLPAVYPDPYRSGIPHAETVKKTEKERAPARFCCAGAFLFRIIALMQT